MGQRLARWFIGIHSNLIPKGKGRGWFKLHYALPNFPFHWFREFHRGWLSRPRDMLPCSHFAAFWLIWSSTFLRVIFRPIISYWLSVLFERRLISLDLASGLNDIRVKLRQKYFEEFSLLNSWISNGKQSWLIEKVSALKSFYRLEHFVST
jgi:hypothetical protein